MKFIHISEDGPRYVGEELDFVYRVNVCRHCDDPPCAEACPSDAIKKRDDGIVILDEDACVGCRNCLEMCPYAVIGFDEAGEKAFKCNMCRHRVEQGLIPACADNVCLAHCIYFGDADEIRALIDAKRRKRRARS
jgi:Fe-S-cluster-containing dehydrogenase component